MDRVMKKLRHIRWQIQQIVNIIAIYLPIGHLRKIPSQRNCYRVKNSLSLGQDGSKLHLIWDRVILPQINKFGHQDISVADFIAKSIIKSDRSNKILLDIGANQGLQSLQIHHLVAGKSKYKCFSIEPHPLYFAMLKKNIANINHTHTHTT